MSFDGYGNLDNMAPLSRVQREAEAEAKEEGRRTAARYLRRRADQENWSEHDREQIIGGLGLQDL